MKLRRCYLVGIVAVAITIIAPAAEALPIMLEGAGGGGLNPWALIANGGKNLVTPAAFGTYGTTRNYNIYSVGANFSIKNYAEIYFDHQYLSLPNSLSNVVGTNSSEQSIVGGKLQVYQGNGVIPAVAVGLNAHFVNDTIPDELGASSQGVDFYAAATGIYPFMGSKLLVDGTLWATKANYMGLLGFGGQGHNGYTIQEGVSVGYFLAKDVMLGAEWRSFPTDNLGAAQASMQASYPGADLKQSDWYDGFIAYMPNHHLSVVAAFVSLGNMVNLPKVSNNSNQNGFYLNVNASF